MVSLKMYFLHNSALTRILFYYSLLFTYTLVYNRNHIVSAGLKSMPQREQKESFKKRERTIVFKLNPSYRANKEIVENIFVLSR